METLEQCILMHTHSAATNMQAEKQAVWFGFMPKPFRIRVNRIGIDSSSYFSLSVIPPLEMFAPECL
jgi:hypothetical protein